MDAQEVVQDTILKYIQSDIELSENQQITAWLVKTCVRASIDIVRKRKKEQSFIEEYSEYEKDSELEEVSEMMWGELKSTTKNLIPKIKSALNKLSEGYKTVLSLILFEGYDYSEVAQILDITESTVRSQYLRAKVKLANIIKE